MNERAQELKAEARASKNKANGERDVFAKVAEMPGPHRAMAERLHAIIKEPARRPSRRNWYGMPAYAKDGKVVCFFQAPRSSEVQVVVRDVRPHDEVSLDESAMWPTSSALTELTAAEEARISARS